MHKPCFKTTHLGQGLHYLFLTITQLMQSVISSEAIIRSQVLNTYEHSCRRLLTYELRY